MPRRKKSIPSYLHHKPSGQAVAKLTLPDGTRKTFYLGPYDSPASREEYRRLLGALDVNGTPPPVAAEAPAAPAADLTVVELIARFWGHVEAHYRHPDGRP